MLQTATRKPLKVYYRKKRKVGSRLSPSILISLKSLPKASRRNSKKSIRRSPRLVELFDGSRPSYNKDGILIKKKTTKKLPAKLTVKIMKTLGDIASVPSVDMIEAHLNQPHIVPTDG